MSEFAGDNPRADITRKKEQKKQLDYSTSFPIHSLCVFFSADCVSRAGAPAYREWALSKFPSSLPSGRSDASSCLLKQLSVKRVFVLFCLFFNFPPRAIRHLSAFPPCKFL